MFGLLCAIIVATSIFSCKQTAKGNETPKPVKIASISVKPTITLKKGETSTLKATILPKGAPQEVKWESDKPAIVSVDEKGVITAKELGTANIKVTSLKDATKTATCVVTVVKAPVLLTEIKLDSETALKKGDTSELTLTISPDDATNVNVNWESSAEAIVSIGEIGDRKVKITAKEVGTANIKVTVKQPKEGGAETVMTKTCKVTVTEAEVALTELKIDSTAELRKYDTKELKVTFIPDNTSNINRGVEWAIDKPAIVSVEEIGDGKVKITAKEVGTANIKVTSTKDSTKTATCKVTVIPPVPVESVSLDKNVLELAYENSETLIATVKPDTASQEVIWSSSDETVATCSPDGVVTAKKEKERKITITATSKTDPSKKATCTVYMAKKKVEGVSFDRYSSITEKSIDMEIGTTKTFKVSTLPEYASPWMKYEVKTGSVVKVLYFYEQGQSLYSCDVNAGDLPSDMKEKTEKITFRSEVKPNFEAVMTINVKRPKATKITVQNKKIGLTDRTHKMEAIVFPQKAWHEVTWTSENIDVVAIDSSSGRIVPIKPGTATIVATATDGSGVKGKATVTVESVPFGVEIDKSAIYYDGGTATLTIKPDAAGSQLNYDFYIESDKPSDLEIKKVENEERIFKIWVKNEKARTAEAKLTVKSRNFSDATRDAYINIKTIIPEAISIEGDDKMYLNETLRFDIDTTKKDSSHPTPNKDVRWEWDNSYSTSGVGASDFEIKQNGKVRLKNPSSNQIGKTFRIKAILDLDNSIVATKVITICPNIAKIVKFNEKPLGCNEWTICDDEDEVRYNGFKYDQLACLVAGQLESLDGFYNKFVITEKSSPTDIPKADHFRETVYTAEKLENATVPNAVMIRMSKVAGSSSSQFVKFYVWPIDPKTEKPVIAGSNNSFDFRIWAEPKGIEFEQGDFEIGKYKDDDQLGKGWRNKKELNEGDVWKYFKVRVVPSDANPYLLAFTTKKGKEENSNSYALHDCITEVKQLSAPDENGWRSVEFHMRDRAGWVKNRTDVCFCLSLNPAFYTNDAKIKAYMHVIQDSSW